jgi:hypothetical protein
VRGHDARMRRRSARRVDVLLALGSVLVALLAMEGALRILDLRWPAFYRPDAVLGQSLIPGAEGVPRDAEAPVRIRINSAGFRDHERALAKPPRTVRVAVLGDSYIEANSLPFEETLPALIERKLAACPALGGRRVEALNFGVAGSGTAQQLLMLQHRARHYAPDIVVLAFFAGNDLRNNSRELQKGGRPYFVESDAGLARVDDHLDSFGGRLRAGPVGSFYYEALPRLRVLQLVNAFFALRRQEEVRARRTEQESGAPERHLEGAELGLDSAVYLPPSTPEWRSAWRVTEALLREVHRESEALGARFLLATLSTGIQVHPDEAVRARFARALGTDDLFYPDRRLEAFAASEGIEAVILAPRLRAWAEEHQTCVHGFVGAVPCGGHWNEHANRFAAERIVEAICPELLPPDERIDRAAAPPSEGGS